MEDKPVLQAPRIVLKNLIATAAKRKLRIKTGVEAEFFLIDPDGAAVSDTRDNATKPCYDQQALMRRCDIISQIWVGSPTRPVMKMRTDSSR
jgi:glutamine synthetase